LKLHGGIEASSPGLGLGATFGISLPVSMQVVETRFSQDSDTVSVGNPDGSNPTLGEEHARSRS
jgi:hypothetical protein